MCFKLLFYKKILDFPIKNAHFRLFFRGFVILVSIVGEGVNVCITSGRFPGRLVTSCNQASAAPPPIGSAI